LKADLPAGPPQCGDAGTNADPAQTSIDYPPPQPDEIDHCYPLLAHNVEQPGDTTPYRVPSGETHACFIFDIPWSGDAQALSFRSHLSPVVHHWLLSDQSEDLKDGTILKDRPNCNFGAQKLYGVAAINQQAELNMPPDVGLRMPSGGSGVRFMLGMHYYNPGDAADDASGVEICLARTSRPQTASIAELGVSYLTLAPHQETDIVSRCKPASSGDIHVIRAFPHMHSRGVGLDTIIHHPNGSSEPLLDVPFDFNNQLAYDLNRVLHTGDTLTTTCHFDNTTDHYIFDGESTDDEMCINFVTAWPAGSLATQHDPAGAEACSDD
jgi:hypothetical protein